MDNINIKVSTVSVPAGFYSYLHAEAPIGHIAKTYSVTPKGWVNLASHPKGVSSPTPDAAREVLRKRVLKEVRALEKNGDLRPSETRRLELLKRSLTTVL